MKKIFDRVNKLIFSEYLLLSIIILFGLIVRLYKINSPIADWHSWRQADTASVTRIYIEQGLNFFYPKYYDVSSIQTGYFNPEGFRFVEFPVFNLIHFVFYQVLPQISLETWGRLVSVLAASFSTLLMFLIGRRIASSRVGLLTAFFFAFLPFNIYFTRVVLPEPLAVSFALFSIWLFLKYFDREKSFFLYSSAIFLSLALLVKPYFFFYAFPMIYLAVKKYGWKNFLTVPRLLIKFLIFSDLVLAPLFFWRGWVGKFPQGVPFTIWAFNGDLIRFHPAFWRWIFAERIGNLILGIWGLVPFSLGIISKKKNFFSLVFIGGAILYLTVVATASVRHDYYQILVIPPIAFLLAEGAYFLWQSEFLNRFFSRLVLLFSVVMMLGIGAYQIKEFYKINHPELIVAGEAVKRLTPSEARILAPYNGDTAFLYQTDRFGWPAIDDSIENLIKRGASYYVSVDLGSADTKYVEAKYQTAEKTSQYIIVNLNKTK